MATPSPMLSKVIRNSAWRWRISSSSRAVSIAMTACAAKLCTSAICFFGEGVHLPAMDREAANQGAILAQRDPQRCAGVRDVNRRTAPRAAMAIGIGVADVDDVNDVLSVNQAIERITRKRRKRLR